jgi:uncharacterized repeat protein (TIGR03843 family)
MTAHPRSRDEDLLAVLEHGVITIEGRMVDASNATLFGTAELDGVELACVYKPTAGERPLWDFPDGSLGLREVSAYEVSAALGWNLVPPTTWREDGPYGQGMAQAWVVAPDESTAEPGAGLIDVVPLGQTPAGWLEIVEAHDQNGRPITLVHADDESLRRMALLDAVINNADRKGGHVLVGRVRPEDPVSTFGVDHGVAFNEDEKLRTVLWGFAGGSIDEPMLDDLESLQEQLNSELGDLLSELLTRRELIKTQRRLARLMRDARFPLPGDGWPSLPWPAF